ncbi:MAG TPA: DNA replication/repair protein RecF [Paludibacteraceae bacterium]|nr:DNA replication/repair protein RecF [Paludibacteraceae bacterium]HRS67748.1 DNA replication/repair protein RecF [Paludibacteraceae bacterium]
MHIDKISILNYRNITECELQFSPKINCFLGQNGMGKTNLLDAIYYLSFCKSHLNPVDTQVIKHGSDFFMLQGVYQRKEVEELISCAVKYRTKKQFKRNKKDYERLSDHIGVIPVVLISPSDLDLITDGSDERRRFLDTVISQYDKPYLSSLIRYNAALQHRNAMMKEQMLDETMLDIYEEQMAIEATYIYQKRAEFIDAFTPVFQQFYAEISAGKEQVALHYTSHLQQGDLRPLLKECRQRDHLLGYTTRGSHKDDLSMLLGEYPMKRTGSQGQNKTYLVALKLAQFVYLKQVSEQTPILLLDDIFDKLDVERVTRIVKLVSRDEFGQIFITDTNREHLDEIIMRLGGDARIFEVVDGVVEKITI